MLPKYKRRPPCSDELCIRYPNFPIREIASAFSAPKKQQLSSEFHSIRLQRVCVLCHHLTEKHKTASPSFSFIFCRWMAAKKNFGACRAGKNSRSFRTKRKMSQNWSILQFLQQHRKEDASNGENIWRLPGLGYHIGAARRPLRVKILQTNFPSSRCFCYGAHGGDVGVCERVKMLTRE